MKQKRFKKLLMSKGYGRNAANEIVKNTIKSGYSYEAVYEKVKLIKSINISCVIDGFIEATKQIAKVAVACAKAIGAFGEAFNEAMKGGEGCKYDEIPQQENRG